MFGGHAPPFGWYWSASKSRTSAPSSTRDLRHLAGGTRDGSSKARRAPPLRGSTARPLRGPPCVASIDVIRRSARASRSRSGRARRAVTCGNGVRCPSLERLAQSLRDRVAGAVADLQQALARRAAAAGEAVAAVLARELDAELLEPVDRGRRFGGEDLDQPPVGGLVGRLPDVLRVLLGRVVVTERRLDAALRLGRVAGLQRAFRRQRDACACALGRDGGGEARGAAADHEHVEGASPPRPSDPTTILLIRSISQRYSVDRREELLDLGSGRRPRVRACAPGALDRRGCDLGEILLRNPEVAQPLEAGEPGKLLDACGRIVRPERIAETPHALRARPAR